MGARSRNSTPPGLELYIEATQSPDVRGPAPLQGHRPRKRFSQSFLRDQGIADAIVRAARLTGSETVIEIGPGLGVLTKRLVKQAHRVVAVEIDRDLASALPASIPAENLDVLQLDALEFDPTTLDLGEYTLVANLPYHITSPLLMRFLHEVTRPQRAVLMMQREVAERVSAPEGHLSYLSVAVQSVATVETIRQVPPTAFTPRPKVDSTVLRITPRDEVVVDAHFLAFVRAGFTQPRKRLANSLAQGMNESKANIEAFLTEQGLAEHTRPHEVPLRQWQQLSAGWSELRQP